MKRIIQYLSKRVKCLIPILFLFVSLSAYSQTCEVTLRNDSLIDAKNLIVDIYVNATSGNFYYAEGQYKVTFNVSIKNGGNITGAIVPGYSDLSNSSQIPTAVFLTSSYWRIASEAIPSSQAACSQISSSGNGTRICRVQLTNSVAFAAFTADMLMVTTSPNATAVWYSDVNGLANNAAVTMVNTNLVNPILNGPITTYNVTGGGNAPAVVGLDGSQTGGVNYILYKGIDPQGSFIDGTGLPFNFAAQPIGTYKIKGHRKATYMYSFMSGSAIVTTPCVPVSMGPQPTNTSMCAVTGNASFSVTVNGDSPFIYQWQYYNGSSWVNTSNGTPSGASYTNVTSATLGVTGITSAGVFQYQCYITNCSGSSYVTSNTATLTVNALPTANAGTALVAICQGGTSASLGGSVGGSATGGTWSTPALGTFTPNATTLNATWTPPGGYSGTATLTLTTSGGSCGTATASKTQVVNPPPSVSAIGGGTASVCVGSTTPAFTDATGGGVWSVVPVTGTASITAGGVVTGLTAGTVTVTYTVTNICGSGSATQSLTVNALPTVSVIGGGAASVCVGSITPAFTDATGGGTWSVVPVSGTASITAGGVVTGLTAGTVTVTYTVTNGCGSISATQSLTVNALPTANAGSGLVAICQGGTSASLGGSVGGSATGGTWSTPALGTFTPNATTLNATWTPPGGYSGTATLTLTTSGGSCGTATASKTQVVNPPPSVSAIGGGTASVCVGSTTPAFTDATGGGVWSVVPVTGTASITAGGVVTGLTAGTVTVTYTVTNICGSGSATQSLTINDLPTANAGTALVAICQGGTSASLGGSVGGSAMGGTWSTPALGTFTPNATTLNATWTPPGGYSGTATLTLTTSGGSCGTATASKTQVVNPPPSVSAIGGGTASVCVGSTTPAFTDATGGGVWSVVPVTGTASITAGGVVTGLTAGTVTVTYTVTNICGSGSATQSLTVNALPTVSVIGGGAASVCVGSITPAFTDATGGGTWSVVPVSGTASITAGGVVTGLTAGTVTVTYTVTNGCGSISATQSLIVNALPTAPLVGIITQPTCAVATGSVVLSGLPTGTWTINPGAIAGSTTSTTISGLAANTYNFTVTNSVGCTSPASGNVIINAQPVTPVIPSQTASILSGGTFVVNPTGGTIPVGTTYTWPAPTYTNGVTGGSAQPIPQANINGTLTIPSGTGTAIYTVTPTSLAGCTGANFTVTVNVSSTCTPVSMGTQPVNSSMCATSGSTTFTVVAGGTGPFTYQWQYYNGSAWVNVVNGTPAGSIYTTSTTATLGVAGITSAGSYQYQCYITNCGGGNNITSNAATLTVNALPVPTLISSDPDNTFCLGTSVTFTAGGGTNYNFRIGGVTNQNGSSTTYTTSSLANGQIVTVVVTNSIGCSATSAQIQNIVNPLPYLIISTPATCSSDFLTYSLGVTVTPGALVTSSSGTANNTSSNLWTISGVLAGINVTVTVTDTKGCQTIQSVTAPNCACPVVLPPVSGGDKFYCAGGVIPALTATVLAGETVDWYNASSGGTLLRSGSLSYTPTTPGTYYAQSRNTTSNCVSSTRTAITLTMNPLPVPTLTSSDADNIFCSGTSVIFTATGGTTYNFLVGGSSVQNGVSATYTTSSLTNGQMVVVIVTNANGCSATSAGITNTVNITPVPTLTSSDADNSFCSGTNVTFTASGGTNYNFRVAGASVQNGSLTTYTTNSLTNGQVVDVIVSNTNGCTATSTGITNSVFDSTTAIAGTGGNNCGPKFHLNGSVPVVGIGTWSQISGPGIATFSNLNTANSFVTIPASAYGSYTFAWTVANGTCSTSATVTVVFIQQPPANAGSGGDVCGESFTMNAPVTTGLGTWAKIIGPGIAVFTPDNHHPDAKVTVDQFGAYSFEWTLVNSTCTSTDTINVVFHDKPALNAGRDTAVCKGSSVQLQAKGTGAVAWVPAALVSNPNIINPIATPDTTTTFTVNLTDQFGCKNSSDIVVEVREKAIANAGPDQVLGYQFTTLMAAVLAHSYENGVWSVISGTGDFVDSTNAKTTVKSLSTGKNKFLWTVTNGYCPVSHDTTMIVVNGFIIPTLITPNGDGRNDYFVLRGLTTTLGKTELIIFDRRGAQVYKNLNYDNSWNGLDYNKNPLPDDTYFYVIKSANGKSISGYIVIRR